SWRIGNLVQSVVVTRTQLNAFSQVESDTPDETVIPVFKVIAIDRVELIAGIAIIVSDFRTEQVSPVSTRVNLGYFTEFEHREYRDVDVAQIEFRFVTCTVLIDSRNAGTLGGKVHLGLNSERFACKQLAVEAGVPSDAGFIVVRLVYVQVAEIQTSFNTRSCILSLGLR